MAWDPLRDLRAWQEGLDRLTAQHGGAWAPPIDVYETDDAYVVSAEVPGLSRGDLDIAIEKSRLAIRGRRPDPPGDRPVHYHQMERGHGAFARTFEFAEAVQPDAISADLRDGVLTIKLPKLTPPPTRRIQVQ